MNEANESFEQAPPTMADWSDKIITALGKSVEAIIEAGRLLIEAKADLKGRKGEFERMVEMEMPFGNTPQTAMRTAQYFMAIGGCGRLAKANNCSSLPSTVRTLYELTRLDDGQWEEAKSAGLLRPDVKRAEVVAIRTEKKEPAQPKPYADPGDAEVDLRNYLDKLVARYPQDQLDRLALILRQIARDMLKDKSP